MEPLNKNGVVGNLVCKSKLLGQDFDFDINISEEGQLTLDVDGCKTLGEIQSHVAQKCQIEVDAVIPLLIVNVVMLQYNAAKQLELSRQAVSPENKKQSISNLTVH